jgi:plastocyanin
MKFLRLCFGSVVMVSLVACGGSSDSASVDSVVITVPATGESVTVDVLDNSIRPLILEIAAGTEVVFDNQGRNDHNLLPDLVSSDVKLRELLSTDSSATAWGVASTDFPPKATYAHVFTTPGVYTFYCSIHGVPGAGMFGTIRVS